MYIYHDDVFFNHYFNNKATTLHVHVYIYIDSLDVPH